MDDFPGNSNAARINRKPNNRPQANRTSLDHIRDEEERTKKKSEKNIEKIVTGRVSRRRKSLGRQFLDTFKRDDDEGSIMEYILFEVVVPDAKNLLYDIALQSLERKLGINTSSLSRTRSALRRDRDRDGHFDYNGRSSRRDRDRRDRDRDRDDYRHLSRRARANHDFDEIEFRDSFDAQKVLRKMREALDYYEIVTVADFYKMVDIPADPPDENWAWSDLDDAQIIRLRNGRGYILDLPKPEYTDD